MVKKQKISIIILVLLFFNYLSCNKNFDYYFNKLIDIDDIECMCLVDTFGIDNCDIYYYKLLYFMGKSINNDLIDKAYSIRQTKYSLCPMPILLNEGDIAIMLLMDINKIDFKYLLPSNLKNKYKSSGAIIWWRWINEDIKNREYVIELIKTRI